MSNVVPHAAFSLARAKRSSSSTVTPFFRPTDEIETRYHQSGGMRSRCHHLEALRESKPKSAASASRVGHRSTTSRNDVSLRMGGNLRQNVLFVKARLSQDSASCGCENKDVNNSEHKQEFTRRVREAREKAGYNQEQISELLGIKQSKYHKYEGRSYMPHYLIHRFCLACRISVESLYMASQAPAVQRQTGKAKAKGKASEGGAKVA
jgi:ribosome-binding protein aMBF1 (putative translation factor)